MFMDRLISIRWLFGVLLSVFLVSLVMVFECVRLVICMVFSVDRVMVCLVKRFVLLSRFGSSKIWGFMVLFLKIVFLKGRLELCY